MFTQHFYIKRLLLLVPAFVILSCTKLVEIPEPTDTVTTAKIFNNDSQAKGAMVSVYSIMINGISGYTGFGCGLTTMMTGLSADELENPGGSYSTFNKNMLDARDGTVSTMWNTAYRAIYGANAVVEGIEASQAPTLHAQVKAELTAEAKFARAFCYFYLVNLYGDVPLALTTDFNKLVTMNRTPKSEVYKQMVKDLEDAVNGLPGDYTAGAGERIRPNKWVAKSLLARVYLFLEEYDKAAAQANDVIAQTALYQLETTDLNRVFLKNSGEAIWQLAQSPDDFHRGNSTPEGFTFLPNPIDSGSVSFTISKSLLNAFEPGDLRLSNWIGTSFNKPASVTTQLWFPYKYNQQLNTTWYLDWQNNT